MSSKRRTLVLLRYADPDDPGRGTVPLARRAEFGRVLARFNTAPDGSAAGSTERYHGPGIVLEIASGGSEVRQALITCNEPDLAWPVLSAICRAGGWKMQDVDSGQVFG